MTTLEHHPGLNGHTHPAPAQLAPGRVHEPAGPAGEPDPAAAHQPVHECTYDPADQHQRQAAAPPPCGGNPGSPAAARAFTGSANGSPDGGGEPAAGATGVHPDAAAAREAAREVARARQDLPTHDPVLFDCFLGGLVRAVAGTTEADPIAILVSLVAACGVQVGPRPHVQVGDDRQPLLVWPLVVGRTGGGRKGASWSSARRLIRAADPEFAASNVRSGLTSGEGLAAVFAAPEPDPDGHPGGRPGGGGAGARRAGPGGGGPAVLPEGDRRLLVFEPEWAAVMARMRREGNSLSATLRAAWEGGDLSTLTVTARIARTSHVGLIAHITPKEFQARVSAADMAGGTYNRFLPVSVARSKFLPLAAGADPDLVAELGAALADRIDRASGIGAVRFTPGGAELWQRLYVEFGRDHGDDHDPAGAAVAEFTARTAPNCLRIAALHAVLDGTDRMDVDHLTAAAALVRYSLASARAVLTANPDLARLAAWIAEAGTSGRTREEVRRDFFKGNKPGPHITAALDALTGAGRVARATRPRADGRPGRATEVFTGPPNHVTTCG